MHFFRDCGVGSATAPGVALPPASMQSSVLESSCIYHTLRFCARCLLALTKKSLFLEALTRKISDMSAAAGRLALHLDITKNQSSNRLCIYAA
jgi:hypothetical protein